MGTGDHFAALLGYIHGNDIFLDRYGNMAL
jgi:hypothetical protein